MNEVLINSDGSVCQSGSSVVLTARSRVSVWRCAARVSGARDNLGSSYAHHDVDVSIYRATVAGGSNAPSYSNRRLIRSL